MRSRVASRKTVHFGPFQFDRESRELFHGGTRVKLQPQPAMLLAMLLERPGELVTRDDLYGTIWGLDTHVDYEQSLNYCVRHLREALGEAKGEATYVETVPKRGYRFVAHVHTPDRRSLQTGAVKTIAVLALRSVGEAQEGQEMLAAGMTDTLISALSKVSNLRVLAVGSMQQADTVELAARFGANLVVKSTVYSVGRKMRIGAQLLQAETGEVLWGDSFDGMADEALALHDRCTREIVAATSLQLTPLERRRLSRRRRVVPEAYDLHLRGWHERGKMTIPSLERAAEYFRQAIEVDPGYSLAYSGLAMALAWQMMPLTIRPSAELCAGTEEAAEAALRLDAENVEAMVAMSFIHMIRHDWKKTEAVLTQALEIEPNNSQALHNRAMLHAVQLQHEQALETMELALSLDPISPMLHGSYACCLYLLRQYERGLKQIRASLENFPEFFKLHLCEGAILLQVGEPQRAVQALEKAIACSTEVPCLMAYLCVALAQSGEAERAEDELERLERGECGYVDPLYVALACMGLGRMERALDLVEEAWDAQSEFLIFLNHDAMFDPIWREERFQRVCRKVGLPQVSAAEREALWAPGGRRLMAQRVG